MFKEKSLAEKIEQEFQTEKSKVATPNDKKKTKTEIVQMIVNLLLMGMVVAGIVYPLLEVLYGI